MAFVAPQFTKSQVSRAGEILADSDSYSVFDQVWASDVLANWRGSHGYPINTFQATLRKKLEYIDDQAIVAQRLKRAPSIIHKLKRFDGMRLARMQDIGGLRAVVNSVSQARKLETAYRTASFQHSLVSSKNYIDHPKDDGYRSIHLIYRYENSRAPDYAGLSLELQIRTKLQHAWATAVETMGTFLGQALKAGEGEDEWRTFFATAGAALSVIEETSPVPGFQQCHPTQIFASVRENEDRLHVLDKLRGFAIAADQITTERGHGAYHLVVLDSRKRTVSIKPYPTTRLDQANLDYAAIEARTKAGEPIEAVLVSAGPIDALRKAYPNYFLDTQEFIIQIERVIADTGSRLPVARES
jgi:putative GTP pyrophosphokinase